VDRIEREAHIAAPVARVWQIVTDPDQMAVWFSDSVEMDPRVGGRMVLRWKEHGDCHAVIERLDPPHLFAFRWAYEMEIEPGEGTSTLVEFILEPEHEGTRLRIVESGFATLKVTDEDRARRLEGNTGGWQEHLDRLREYAGQ
jgi:uncharacterized protein YndB with AHSA1/START domain